MKAAIIVAASLAFLLILESVLRINVPEYSRPSTIITAFASFVSEWAYFIGQQIGRFLDIWYIIKDLFGKDLYALCTAIYKVIESPWYIARGFIAYYVESTTPIIFVYIIVALITVGLLYYHGDFIRKIRFDTTEEIQFMIALIGSLAVCGLLFSMVHFTWEQHHHHGLKVHRDLMMMEKLRTQTSGSGE